MKTPLDFLNEIRIASPCPMAWEEMNGDNRVRHCSHCQRHVYDLSEMTAQEAVDFIQKKEGRLCVTLYRREDGTVLTADCPVGFYPRMKDLWRSCAALCASLLTVLLIPVLNPDGPGGFRQQVNQVRRGLTNLVNPNFGEIDFQKAQQQKAKQIQKKKLERIMGKMCP